MIWNKNRLVTQERRESYGDEAAEGATAILQGDNEFDGVYNEFEAARAEENAFDAARSEESTARARSQRAGKMYGHTTGTANKREEDEEEGNAAGN